MVDSISGKPNQIQDAGLLNVGQQQSSQAVEKVNVESAQDAGSASVNLLDNATISDEAKKAYESEKEILRFSRLAQRVKEPVDMDKVSQLKNMLDSGRINEYLRSLDPGALADSLLNSPTGAFLR